jgi:hypothetical protein
MNSCPITQIHDPFLLINTIPTLRFLMPTFSEGARRTALSYGKNPLLSNLEYPSKVILILEVPRVVHIQVRTHLQGPFPVLDLLQDSGSAANTPRSLSPTKRTGNISRDQSPTKQVGEINTVSPRNDTPGSLTPSRPPSRAASPLRFLQQWALHRTHSRDEPFIPIDPFKWHFRICSPRSTNNQSLPITCCIPIVPIQDDRGLFSDTLPRQLYLSLLLRLPAVYFSRVARIFEDAEVSRNDMQRIIESNRPSKLSTASNRATNNAAPTVLPFPEDWTPPAVSPALARFKNSWEEFIDSLLREWKTLNLVSALICSSVVSA